MRLWLTNVWSKVRRVPLWIWLLEVVGAGGVLLAWLSTGFDQAALLAFGAALLLGVPLALMQQGLIESLTSTVTRAVEAAEGFRLTGGNVPQTPEELEMWPFAINTTTRPDSQVRLNLVSSSPTAGSNQPMEVMIVVTDPIGRTFNTDRRLTSYSRQITSWDWPNDFTSGDIREGTHKVAYFVAPISVGPSRRFGLAAESTFVYVPSSG